MLSDFRHALSLSSTDLRIHNSINEYDNTASSTTLQETMVIVGQPDGGVGGK